MYTISDQTFNRYFYIQSFENMKWILKVSFTLCYILLNFNQVHTPSSNSMV